MRDPWRGFRAPGGPIWTLRDPTPSLLGALEGDGMSLQSPTGGFANNERVNRAPEAITTRRAPMKTGPNGGWSTRRILPHVILYPSSGPSVLVRGFFQSLPSFWGGDTALEGGFQTVQDSRGQAMNVDAGDYRRPRYTEKYQPWLPPVSDSAADEPVPV